MLIRITWGFLKTTDNHLPPNPEQQNQNLVACSLKITIFKKIPPGNHNYQLRKLLPQRKRDEQICFSTLDILCIEVWFDQYSQSWKTWIISQTVKEPRRIEGRLFFLPYTWLVSVRKRTTGNFKKKKKEQYAQCRGVFIWSMTALFMSGNQWDVIKWEKKT